MVRLFTISQNITGPMNKLQPHHSLIQSVCFSAHSESNKPQEFPLGLRLLSAWGMCVCVCVRASTRPSLSLSSFPATPVSGQTMSFLWLNRCALTHMSTETRVYVSDGTQLNHLHCLFTVSVPVALSPKSFIWHIKKEKKRTFKDIKSCPCVWNN